MTLKWMGKFAVVVLMAVTTHLVVQSPASASIGQGITLRIATSVSDSATSKGVSARCPAGTSIVGGGGRILNHGGKVALVTMLPGHSTSGSGDGYSVAATEVRNGYSGNWSVQAYAFCTSSVIVPDLEVKTAFTTGADKRVAAECPAGKVVLGTGGAVGAGDQGAVLNKVAPSSHSATVFAHALVAPNTNPPADFLVMAAAVCATKPLGYSMNSRFDVPNGDVTGVNLSMTCPGVVIGLGAEITSNYGRLTGMYADLLVARMEAAKFVQPPENAWAAWLYVICAT